MTTSELREENAALRAQRDEWRHRCGYTRECEMHCCSRDRDAESDVSVSTISAARRPPRSRGEGECRCSLGVFWTHENGRALFRRCAKPAGHDGKCDGPEVSAPTLTAEDHHG
jgi:hypothetical protein